MPIVCAMPVAYIFYGRIWKYKNLLKSANYELEIAHKHLQNEKEKSEQLLLNILPYPIAEKLKSTSGTIAQELSNVTILFADIVGFTSLASKISAKDLVELLNEIFTCFDRLTGQYDVEKIKTIGDAYFVAGGIPTSSENDAKNIADMALAMKQEMQSMITCSKYSLKIRIGIHKGTVVAGVIGEKKFTYDVWGDTVNTASRMESHGIPDRIHVSEQVYEALNNMYIFQERGFIEIKGKGKMKTFFLEGKKE
ncbi:MAG: hypothetical protein HQK79_11225 [Desulfobacterales bacterium]|nr:hypothetical protein [Desulfobacterales bacterium]